MILDVAPEHIAQLNDTDLRALVAYLCEREMRAYGHSSAAVTWGGHQNASDGGVDVRVALPPGATITGYVPRSATGFQVKAQDMPRQAILTEMAPTGRILPSILELAAYEGAYIIVSSKGSASDKSLRARRAAMAEAIARVPGSSSLALDFYDRRRMASWVNQHASLVPWVRQRLGLSLAGWRSFEDWSSSPSLMSAPYLLDAHVRLLGPTIHGAGLDAEAALRMLRGILAQPKSVVRLTGLSGVGKTRLVQALFDERVAGGHALLSSDALYTDLSDDPDPTPQEMLARLTGEGHRAVLIIDNCGAELHEKLAKKLVATECSVSLITVEYDISDDQLPETHSFKLEPASSELIARMLAANYPAVSALACEVIAQFSEGNARIAFVLAETAKNGESLAGFNDTALFERLFNQKKTPSAELLDAAKVCALVYSFDGETVEGATAELISLAGLAGQTVDQLHLQLAELFRRQLLQKRGKWRAILPQALANRLAKRALEDVPFRRIERELIDAAAEYFGQTASTIAKGARPFEPFFDDTSTSIRLLRSFARRLKYLSDSPQARQIVERWLTPEGLLGKLGRIAMVADIFEKVAPVWPEATLSFLERTAATNESWFFSEEHKNRDPIHRVLRALAYEPALFERCVALLRRFAINGDTNAKEALQPLFRLFASGTHASLEQKVALVSTLLHSDSAPNQELGLYLLECMLSWSDMPVYPYEFGAWKRDFGYAPQWQREVDAWFDRVIETARAAASSGKVAPALVRAAFVRELAALAWNRIDDVVRVVDLFAGQNGWSSAWAVVRDILREGADRMGSPAFEKLEALGQRLRPADLTGLIREQVYAPADARYDPDPEKYAQDEFVDARQKVSDRSIELGQQLAVDIGLLTELLPELLASGSYQLFDFGRGLARGCHTLEQCWALLRVPLEIAPLAPHNNDLIRGFLEEAAARSLEQTEALLDTLLDDVRFHTYVARCQGSVPLSERGLKRLMRAVALPTVPVDRFSALARIGTLRPLRDEPTLLLVRAIAAREGGADVASQVLSTLVLEHRIQEVPIPESIRRYGLELLSVLDLQRHAWDYQLGALIEACFDTPDRPEARHFCERLLAAIRNYRSENFDDEPTFSGIIHSLAMSVPTLVLDLLLELPASDGGRTIFGDYRNTCLCPLHLMSEDAWIEWAAAKPQLRYVLLAEDMQFLEGDDENAKSWLPVALKLIAVAPEPDAVLSIFVARFRPHFWLPLLDEVIAPWMPLFDTLKQNSRAAVREWATEQAPRYAAQVQQRWAEERARTTAHQSFE